jgi:hypothetical protein
MKYLNITYIRNINIDFYHKSIIVLGKLSVHIMDQYLKYLYLLDSKV